MLVFVKVTKQLIHLLQMKQVDIYNMYYNGYSIIKICTNINNKLHLCTNIFIEKANFD